MNDKKPLVLVVGASGGIGTASVRCLLHRGVSVIGIDREGPSKELEASNEYRHIAHDITTGDNLKGLLDENGLEALDHVVMTTGGTSPEEVQATHPLNLSEEDFTKTIVDNLVLIYAIIRGTHNFLGRSVSDNRSYVVASSINAYGDFGYPAYSAAKAGLEGLVRSLSRPLARDGIRIGVVTLGTVVTERSKRLHESDSHHYGRLLKLTDSGRFLTPEEAGRAFAAAVLDLLGCSGFNLVVDVGQSLPGNHTE